MPGFRSLFARVRERPGMWFGHDPTYRELCAFLMGCDAATDFSLLRGFREWLVVKTDGPDNLDWDALIPAVHLPGRRGSGPFRDSDDRVLVEALWDALFEFHDDCSEFGGHARIFEAYVRWRGSRPYHDADPVGSLNEREGVIDSPPPEHASDDAHEVHRIRRIPVSALSVAECTKFVKLWLSIETIVPRSTELLSAERPHVVIAGTPVNPRHRAAERRLTSSSLIEIITH